MLVPLTQWAPDVDETEQGLLVDVNNMIPSQKGYKGSPSPVSTGVAALAAECRGAGFVTILNGTSVLFAGTQTKLYKGSATTWTDVTRIASDYTGSATSRWRFAQQGDITIAVNKVDTSQFYNHASASDFIDMTEMPKAAVVEAVGQFILIGNYNNGTDYLDGWGCSAVGDYTEWTASVDTQCVYGRLLDTPGEITGLKRLGDYAIYYKRKSMYLARYVGTPTVWEFSLVSDIIGSVGQESIVKAGTTHYFLSDDNFYAYDTASVTPIGNPLKEWFNMRCNNQYRNKTLGVHDRIEGVVYWVFPAGTSTTPNEFVAFHYRTGRWGRGELAAEAAAEYVTGAKTYADILTAYPTYAAFSGLDYEDIQTSQATPVPSIVDTSHIIKTLTGISGTGTITTNDFGIDNQTMLVRRVRPRYVKIPESATITNYYRDQMGADITEDATTTEVSGKFDYLRSARWHRGKLTFTGNVEITALDVDAKAAGKE